MAEKQAVQKVSGSKVGKHFLKPCRVVWYDAYCSDGAQAIQESDDFATILFDTIGYFHSIDELYVYLMGELDVTTSKIESYRHLYAIPILNIVEMQWLKREEKKVKVSSLKSSNK